ncbi:hypothetical protein HK15_09690, partial [Acetobacter orientalis]
LGYFVLLKKGRETQNGYKNDFDACVATAIEYMRRETICQAYLVTQTADMPMSSQALLDHADSRLGPDHSEK